MRHKCSPSTLPVGLPFFVLLLVLILSACSTSENVAEGQAADPAADTSATASAPAPDTLAVEPSVPVTLPRVPTRIPQRTQETTFERPAYAQLQQLPGLSAEFVTQFGVRDPQEWGSAIARATVSFPTCSGMVVSGDGLVATSASCLSSSLAATGGSPLPDAAFLATSGSEQLLQGLEALVVIDVVDVTSSSRTLRTANPSATAAAIHQHIADSLAAAAGVSAPDVVVATDSLTHALVQRRITDVRLVFVPEPAVRDFGGNYDEGSYPQFKFDVAFVRLVDGSAPMQMPSHLSWGDRSPRIGAPVFATGAATLQADEAALRTPVVSGGRIRGFSYDATEAPPVATLYGLYDRHFSFGEQSEWALPDEWLRARDTLPKHEAISVAATTEYSDGMQGGALLGFDQSYQGTIYDVNTEAAADVVGRIRTVAVPATATTLLLQRLYDAAALTAELANGGIQD